MTFWGYENCIRVISLESKSSSCRYTGIATLSDVLQVVHGAYAGEGLAGGLWLIVYTTLLLNNAICLKLCFSFV